MQPQQVRTKGAKVRRHSYVRRRLHRKHPAVSAIDQAVVETVPALKLIGLVKVVFPSDSVTATT